MKVTAISSYEAFLSLREPWNALLDRSQNPVVFLTHDWLKVWWQSFGTGKELLILLVHDGDELIAIAPLMLQKTNHIVFGKAKVSLRIHKVGLMANEHSFRSGFILSRSPQEACDAIVKYLIGEAGSHWELFLGTKFPRESSAVEALSKSFHSRGIPSRSYHHFSSPFIPIKGSWEEFFEKLQPRFRRSLRSKRAKLERLGPVRLVCYTRPDQLDVALPQVFRIASRSWKAGAGTDLSSAPEVRQFYTELAGLAAQRGWLRLYILWAGEEPLVFDYCLRFRDKLYDLKTEYDEAYASYGVGNLLKREQLEGLFDGELDELDLLGEPMHWKRLWAGRNEREHIMLFAFSRHLRGRLLNRIYAAKDLVRRTSLWEPVKG